MDLLPHSSVRRANTLAGLAVDPRAGDGVFLTWPDGPAYFSEARAVCALGQAHPAPGADCDCGFPGSYDVPTLLDLLEPTIAEVAGAALLDVELAGGLTAGSDRTRAAQQQVFGAKIIRWCAACRPEEVDEHGPADLYGIERRVGLRTMHGLVTRCQAHVGEQHLRPYALGDVAGMLRTELTWAPEAVIAALLDRRRARLVLGQQHGPLLGQRRVAELRMGQVGFTALDGLRLDDQGRLWVEVRGPASQRPLGEAVVPVHRAVDLRLELVVPRPTARRIDLAIGGPRPKPAGRLEAEIARVEGLDHLPRVAAAWRHRTAP